MLKDLLGLYDLTYNKLCILNDNTLNSAKNITETHRINSISTLSFEMPLQSTKWKYIVNNNLVEWKDELYKISNLDFTHSNEKKTVTVQCRHMSSGLEGMICSEFKLVGKTAKELMTNVLNRTTIITDDAGNIIDSADFPSNWSVGIVDIPDTVFRSLETSKDQSVFSNLVKIAETFQATLYFHARVDIKNNMVINQVDLIQTKLDRQIQIRKGKNLKSVNVVYGSDSPIVTRLFAFGGSDEVTQQEVNIMGAYEIDENGNKTDVIHDNSYIEDNSWYTAQGYDLDFIHEHPELFLYEQVWRDSVYLDSQDLLEDAYKKLKTISKPQVKCKVEGLDLSIFPEYFTASPTIGEVVYIIDEDLNLSLQAQVVEISKNSQNLLGMSISVSNEVEYNSILNTLTDTSKITKKNTTGSGLIRGMYIENASIDNAKIKDATITSAKIDFIDAGKVKTGTMEANRISGGTLTLGGGENGNGVASIKDLNDNEIVKLDNTGININNGKITIKDSNNTTVIDSNGVNGSAITNGIIDGDTVQFKNIDAKSIKSGTLTGESIHGGTLTLGGSLGGVESIQDSVGNEIIRLDSSGIAVKDGKITITSKDGTTVIDEKGVNGGAITQGYIKANRIQGGELILGGVDNTNGLLRVKDATNNDSVILNTDGIAVNNGKIVIADNNGTTILNGNGINANTITVGKLKGDLIEGGTVTADKLMANTITAGSGVIAQGAIGNAHISSLQADKLTSGTVNTSKVTVQGENGRIKIAGNRLQVFDTKEDSSLYERVSLGDVDGDGSIYGFRVRGKDGTTVLLDENGVKREGITDGSINNSKISDDANIDGKKLDIASVVTEVNNGTETINGSKVLLTNKTLDVEFGEIKTTQNSQGQTISNHTSQITALNNEIATKVSSQTYIELESNYNNFVSSTTQGISDLQSQIDGNITNWFFDGKPTLTNLPASLWATNEVKNIHLGDIYYDNLNGRGYRFRLNVSTYEWFEILDSDIVKALADAKKAQDTADGKRRVFTTTPVPPYDLGDLWSQGTNGDLMKCKAAKTVGQTYSSGDWEKATKYTDDTKANEVSGRLTTAESTIVQHSNQIATKVTQTEIDNSINNIQVGGKNILLKTGIKNGEYQLSTNVGSDVNTSITVIDESTAPFGKAITLMRTDASTVSGGRYWSSPVLTSGNLYSWSIYLKGSGTWSVGHEQGGTKVITLTDTWTKYTNIYTASNSIYHQFIFYRASGQTGGVLSFHSLILEEGNKPTSWSPSPEDVQSQIDDATSRLTTAESSIIQNADNINLKVSKNNVISEINQSAEGVKIIGNKLDITGAVTFNSFDSSTQTMVNNGNTAKSTIDANKTKWDSAESNAKTYADTKVDNIQIGGRNLLLGSQNYADTNYWGQNGTTSISNETYLGSNIYYSKSAWGSKKYYLYDLWFNKKTKADTEYTISAYIKASSASWLPIVYFYSNASYVTNTSKMFVATTEWQRISVTFKFTNAFYSATSMTKDNTNCLKFEPSTSPTDSSTQYLMVCGLQLEEGNKPTSYTVAPEDTDTLISTAQSTADTAKTNAETANNELTKMSSDNKLTPVEKLQVNKEWEVIKAEKARIDVQADIYGITTEKTNYGTSYNTLNTYITPLLSNLTTTSDITRATFIANFKDYYDKRQLLLNAITTKTKTYTDTAKSSAISTASADATSKANTAESNAINSAKDYTHITNQLLNIDNTQSTLFHFDKNLCSTNGINPIGNYVATLRQNEGKFGGCVANEEGTTNLFTNPKMETTTGWIASNSSIFSSESLSPSGSFPDGVNSCIKNTVGTSQTNGYTIQTPVLTLNTKYTCSMWVYIPSSVGLAKATISVWYSNNGWQGLGGVEITERDKWVYKTLTFTSNSTYTTHIIGVGLANATSGNVSYACKAQLEQKSFATSFVNGTRARGELKYDVLLNNSYTINFFFKPLVLNNYSTSMNWVITDNPYSGKFIIWKRVDENYYRFRVNGADITFLSTEIIGNIWSMISIVANETNTKIFLNGVLKGTINSVISLSSISIGNTGSETGNNLFDELFLTNKVLSDSEIQTIYNLQQPFYDANPMVIAPKATSVTISLS